jgi:hypothetical protein
VPIKIVQGLPNESVRGGLDFKQVVHWLRVHLGGRRHVDLDLLKNNVLNLTERQWWQALGTGPTWQRRQNLAGVSCGSSDTTTLADRRFDPAEKVYVQELLSIVENNLMSEEIPYFRALLERTTAAELAATLGANLHTTSKRLKRVRIKVQSIIKSLDNRLPSSET